MPTVPNRTTSPALRVSLSNFFTSGDILVASSTTDASGNASFTGLGTGDYYLRYQLPPGHTFTPKVGSLIDNGNSDARTGSTNLGKTDVFSVAAAQTINYVDAGMWAPGSVTTNVWDDQNANSTKQNNEPGIESVTVKLYSDVDDVLLGSQTTDANGNAKFNGVPADRKVYLIYNLPPDHAFTPFANDLKTNANSDARPGQGGRTDAFEIAQGSEHITYVDAGMWTPGSITTNVWDDRQCQQHQTKQRARY